MGPTVAQRRLLQAAVMLTAKIGGSVVLGDVITAAGLPPIQQRTVGACCAHGWLVRLDGPAGAAVWDVTEAGRAQVDSDIDPSTGRPWWVDARVIDIAAAYIMPGRPMDLRQAYIDPGVPIPQESIDVHGLTDDFIQANGKPPAEVLDLHLGEIAAAMRDGAVLLIQNARYDLTVLDRDARRNDVEPLADRLGGRVAPVLDPIVLDKRLIQYRSRVSAEQGARVLKTLADIYGVQWQDELAHGAGYDATITARVAWRMAAWCAMEPAKLAQQQTCRSASWKKVRPEDAEWFRAVAAMSPMELHDAQTLWAAEQAAGLAIFWRGQAAEKREHAGWDNPPPIDGLPGASPDERREVLRQQADQLDADADSVRGDWPIVPMAVSA